jgi:hypothetical protein
MLSAFLVRGVGVVAAAITASSIAQTAQPETKPAPAATPAPEAKPDPKLLPWRDRVPPRRIGGCFGYLVSVDRGLELVLEAHPEFATRVEEIKKRRQKWLGGGRDEVIALFRKMNVDTEEVARKVNTPEQDAKLRELIKADVNSVLENWGFFERVQGTMDPVALLYSLNAEHETDPALALREKLLTPWSGTAAGPTETLSVDVELPLGWGPGPAPSGNIVMRMASTAGLGNALISVFAEPSPGKLTPEQEATFWNLMKSKEPYEKKPGFRVLEIVETKVQDRKAVQLTGETASKTKTTASRGIMRQVVFLDGGWVITVQMMYTEFAKPTDEIPLALTTERLAKYDPVWDHLLASMKLTPKPTEPAPALPDAPKPATPANR